ncbi:hypothetical protein [Pseudomonas soli]|uniref:hypothetical protein n=1 Tax=Pseudomonas soli TaxID=1306993 RepID=UPI0028AEDB0D|nr:hypothetical protein [Pseudomonas soli]
MIIQRRVAWIFVCLQVLLLSVCGVASHAQASSVNDEQRLYDIKEPMDLQDLSTRPSSDTDVNFLKALKQAGNIEDARFIDINPALVKAGLDRFSVPLPNGDIVRFQQRKVYEESNDSVFWFGDIVSDRKQRYASPNEVDIDPVSRIMLVRQGQRLSGEIHLPGQFYRLENAGAGRYALIKLDSGNDLECDPLYESSGKELKKAVSGLQPRARSTIRVMFVTTAESIRVDPHILGRVHNLLAAANETFQRSRVDLEFEDAGLFPSNLIERELKYDPTNILRAVRMSGEIDAIRTSWGGDLVVAIVSELSFAGKSYVSTRKETAFTTIRPVSSGDFLAHQLGHLLGAEHTWRPGDPDLGPPRYRFGHELSIFGSTYLTIMSRLDCKNRSCINISHFSDPLSTYYLTPLGTWEHNNNVRHFNEVRDRVSKYYP